MCVLIGMQSSLSSTKDLCLVSGVTIAWASVVLLLPCFLLFCQYSRCCSTFFGFPFRSTTSLLGSGAPEQCTLETLYIRVVERFARVGETHDVEAHFLHGGASKP